MMARLRATASTTTEPAHDADDEAEGMFFRDDMPEVDRDAQPDYSPAREQMLQRFWDERDQPVATGE